MSSCRLLLLVLLASVLAAPGVAWGQGCPQTEESSFLCILARESKFFPDLVYTAKPLDTKEKFNLSLEKSVDVPAVLGSSLMAGVSQATDTPSGYGQGSAGYGKRFGASMATRASINFFGNFALASALHQDPRFFLTPNAGLGRSARDAARRMVVARKDDGSEGFNWSGLLGRLMAQGLANAYLSSRQQTAGDTFRRYGISVAGGVGVNFIKEYGTTLLGRLTKDRAKP